MNIREAIREFLLDCEAGNLSEHTLRWYQNKLKGFRVFTDENGQSTSKRRFPHRAGIFNWSSPDLVDPLPSYG